MASTSSSVVTPSMSASTSSTTNSTSTNITSLGTDSPSTTTTSSSDKKTTKLSTSSINESTNLNSPSASSPEPSPVVGQNETSISISTTVPINPNKDNNDNNDDGSHLDEELDADDEELVTEEACSNTTVEADLKNENKNDHEELNEFSCSSVSTISTSSGEAATTNKFTRKVSLRSSNNIINNIDMDSADDTKQPSGMDSIISTSIPVISTSSRKREHNRRKCSDPVSVKKIQRLEESEDEEEDLNSDFDDGEDEDYDESYEIEHDLGYYDVSNLSRSRRKQQRCTRSSVKKAVYVGSDLRSRTGRYQQNRTKSNRNNINLPLIALPLFPIEGVNDYTNINQEKLINSSNEEYETCITQSKSHYNLKWKNHQTHILLAFESLLQNETFCDVTLICDTNMEEEVEETKQKEKDEGHTCIGGGAGQDFEKVKDQLQGKESSGVRKLKAHKIILSACSDYFQRIFADNPCKHPVIVLKDYQAWEIQALLDFMYRGEVNVSLERLESLVKSAESLQIRGLTDSIGKLSPDHFNNHPFSPIGERNNKGLKKNPQNPYSNMMDKSFARKSEESLNEIKSQSLPDWDDGALNLSMDLKGNGKSTPEIEIPKSNTNRNNIKTGKPQNRRKTSILQIQSDTFPTNITTTTSITDMGLGKSNHPQEILYHHSDHHEMNFDNNLLPEDNHEEGEIHSDYNQLNVIGLARQQALLPRRKQARPRRRSGDYIAQDLSRAIPTLSIQQNDMNFNIQEKEEYNTKIKITNNNRGNAPDSQRESPDNHHLGNRDEDEGSDFDNQDESGGGVTMRSNTRSIEGGTLMTRLVHRRLHSSRRLNQGDPNPNPMNLRNNRSFRSNNNSHTKDESDRERIIIDEEQQQQQQQSNRGLDYTTGIIEGNINKKLRNNNNNHSKMRGISGGNTGAKLGYQNLLNPQSGHPFMRNWSPTMGHHNTMTPPPGLHRSSPMKAERDSDDGISSTADQCQSPPLSPFPLDPKHLLSNSRHPHDFSLFGLHPDQRHNLASSLTFNKHSPPSPSNFFMNPLAAAAAMSQHKPLQGGARGDGNVNPLTGDESRAETPPDIFSQAAGFQMNLQLTPGGHMHHGHQMISSSSGKDHHHERESSKESRRGGNQKDGARGSPVGWPGLPLGPPPIFGRHRAQHSAPRGGPPRAWSNADLTEALHNVWNKKMTTSQASRIFGIPYNSLLMYVRGKYGKSLKLDLLKKGLDQAMENSQNSLNNNSSGGGGGGSRGSPSSSTNINSNTNNSSMRSSNTPNSDMTTSPTANNNHGNSNPSPPSVKGHSNLLGSVLNAHNEHNNNNNNSPTGMGHLHHHHHHHKSSKNHNHSSSHNTNNHSIELPHDLPPGFNPFAAASLFGEYPSPFPFASALSHILPQSLVNEQHGSSGGGGGHGHSVLGMSLNHSSSNKSPLIKNEVSIGDEDK